MFNVKYNVILADPPWSYDDKLDPSRKLKYDTMNEFDIGKLPVKNIAAADCALFMWATFPKLREAFIVMDAWGFQYKTVAFVWVKVNKLTVVSQASFFPTDSFDAFWGMGRWTRSNAEICLLGVRGQPKRLSGGVHQIIYAPIDDQHSKKPAETRDRIVELMGDVPRVELFARQSTKGWDTWGNEIENTAHLTQAATTALRGADPNRETDALPCAFT